ncbi:MAG: endonuclease/exonuclease/phosphatase family protein [Opitutaceae bacterium]
MHLRAFFPCGFLIVVSLASTLPARDFEVVAYNVENLFDADGVSLFEDYQPPGYTPGHLVRKLAGISRVLKQFGDGRGPDVVLFVELEADQTPDSSVSDVPALLDRWKTRTVAGMLSPRAALDPEIAGIPSHAWLAKQLSDDGFAPCEIAVGQWRPDPDGRTVAHVNAVFSRFPIRASRTFDTAQARGILEVTLEVDGEPLHVFVNHWKSGASDPGTEPARIENAKVLKRRLDEILRADPQADIVIGGDLNSHYNQKQRHPEMGRTAINDVLGSQGNELAVAKKNGPALYNLWFELPNEKRGSDVYRDEWGTLMHLLVTRGLYDFRGVQYVDNSFNVGAFPGLNAQRSSGRPIRWQFADGGVGYSDHFPVAARFRTVDDDAPQRWLALEHPSRTVVGPAEGVPVRISTGDIVELSKWPANRRLLEASHIGRFFDVSGEVTSTRPSFKVRIDGPDVELMVWIHDRAARNAFFKSHRVGDPVRFVGELGQYRGEWQFVIPESLVPRSN